MVIYMPVLCYGVKMAFKKAGNGSTVANIILNLAAQIGLRFMTLYESSSSAARRNKSID